MRFDRRELLSGAALAGGGTALGSAWPAWARSVAPGRTAPIPEPSGEDIALRIARQQTVTMDRRDMPAIGINGTVPAPLLRPPRARTTGCMSATIWTRRPKLITTNASPSG